MRGEREMRISDRGLFKNINQPGDLSVWGVRRKALRCEQFFQRLKGDDDYNLDKSIQGRSCTIPVG